VPPAPEVRPGIDPESVLVGQMQSTTIGASGVTTEQPTTKTKEGSSGSPEQATSASPGAAAAAAKKVAFKRPETPEYFRGKEGTKKNVASNYLQLECETNKGIFHYEVDFEPQIDNRQECFRLLKALEEITGPVKSFDGRKLFLPFQLDNVVTKGTATHSVTGESVVIKINFKSKREMGADRDVVQHYNILFNRIMRALKLSQHNRNFFDPKAANHIRQYNLQVWPGYVNAVDEFEGGVMLQIDLKCRVLRTESVRDLLEAKARRGGDDWKRNVQRELLNTSVLTRYNNRTYKISDIDFDQTPMSKFALKSGEEMTYVDYYKRQYNITIKDTKQPLLLSLPEKTSESEKDVLKALALIPELCMLTGLTDQMRSDFRIMKEVGNYTHATPQARINGMRQFLQRIQENDEARRVLSDWGLRLANNAICLQGRLLDKPTLIFGNRQFERLTRSDWSRAASTKPALTPVNLEKWAIIFTSKDRPVVERFCKTMQKLAPGMGIQIRNPAIKPVENDRTDTFLKAISEVVTPETQLVMTVVPQQKSDRYAAIKKLCYMEKPVANQVVLAKTIANEKKFSAVATKVILQMNCKLGGELWACESPVKNLMVVGIDVYHAKGAKSVAGVVASLNDYCTRFHSEVAVHSKNQELLHALPIIFLRSLNNYHDANGKYPDHIVVFRDGVSDGQMSSTKEDEAESFIRMFSQVGEPRFDSAKDGGAEAQVKVAEEMKKFDASAPSGYNPAFNFIVVQKRINTRIFALQSDPKAPGDMKVDNPESGVVLDHTVTRRNFQDFFLVPQNVNQGTVTPTHFVNLCPKRQKALGADLVQKLSYHLTHMYFNWPGTVRVPAPVQYAHKMVDMAGAHLGGNLPSRAHSDRLYFL